MRAGPHKQSLTLNTGTHTHTHKNTLTHTHTPHTQTHTHTHTLHTHKHTHSHTMTPHTITCPHQHTHTHTHSQAHAQIYIHASSKQETVSRQKDATFLVSHLRWGGGGRQRRKNKTPEPTQQARVMFFCAGSQIYVQKDTASQHSKQTELFFIQVSDKKYLQGGRVICTNHRPSPTKIPKEGTLNKIAPATSSFN